MSAVRPYRPADDHALARICVLTGDDGGDATGVFDDDLLPELFLLPYLERHPDLAFVLADDAMVAYGYSRGQGGPDEEGGMDDVVATAGYPAHLHIDLLPRAQGGGSGRVLIGVLADALRARGCEGLHASASPANPGALAFYPRVGFVPVGGDDAATFGLTLR